MDVEKNRRDPTLIAADKTMLSLMEMARRIAPSEATVLLQGESGTGKEVFARYIHAHSQRSNGLFAAMNCAALPETLAESELFGFEKGAFTGALNRKIGKFEQAGEGTLLLDEISEMPLNLQPKLLRVLQEKTVTRIGGHESIGVNARIVATTNQDLLDMVKKGRFRQDLYYRLRVIPFNIPSLRERRSDIPLLVDYFIAKCSAQYKRPLPVFSPETMQCLQNWKWPGNVRELENTVERAILICPDNQVGPEHLLLDGDLNKEGIADAAQLVGMTVKELEEKLIIQTLSHVNHNRTEASRILGISIRTLRNKLHEYSDKDQQGPPLAAAQ